LGGDYYALAIVAYPAGQPQFLRQSINERAKAYALNLAAHPDTD
jgi:hypothetical protein